MDIEREKEIQRIMESTGLPRFDAELIYAHEHDEIDGDVIGIKPGQPIPVDDE